MEKVGEATPKQVMFATFVAEGDTQIDAYEKAYSPKSMKRTTMSVEASRTARLPHVAAIIEDLKAERQTVARVRDKVNEAWIRERLVDEATNMDTNSGAVRVRALELLGRERGMFKDDVNVKIDERSEDEIKKELQERLAALLGPKVVREDAS